MPRTDLQSLFTASQLRRIAATRRHLHELSTGRFWFDWKGQRYVIKMGAKSHTVHGVFAA